MSVDEDLAVITQQEARLQFARFDAVGPGNDMDCLEVHTNFTSTQKLVYGLNHLRTHKRPNATTA